MTLSDFLQVLRRRWLVAVLGFLAVVGASVATLQLQTPKYQSTVTLALVPAQGNDGVGASTALSAAPSIMPIVSEAVTSGTTYQLAQSRLPAGVTLGSIASTTYSTDAPTVLQVTTESTSATAAAQSAQAYYDALTDQVENGNLLGTSNLLDISEVARPQVPTTPSSPHKSTTIGIGILIGLVVAGAAAWLRETLGGRIETADALSSAADLPVFGEVPETRRVPSMASVEAWLTDDNLRFVNEAMRDLSLTLQLTHFDADSVLVTSPEGRHGKTTVAFGIAVALARSGVETLLVDGDLRRGRLEEMFADEPDHPVRKTPGLADVLSGSTVLEEAIQSTSLPHLSVLTSGTLMDDPSELLDVAFPAALRAMERRSAVVIDGTPLLPINDARVIAKFAGATVMVASAGGTTRAQVKRALDRIRIIGVSPSAVVLNKVRQRHSADYGHYLSGSRTKSRVGSDDQEPSLRLARDRKTGALSRNTRPEMPRPEPGPAPAEAAEPGGSARVSLVGSEHGPSSLQAPAEEWPDDEWGRAQQP
jgi:succinoglycan biosynthesis transport protein ExoP